MAELCQDDVPYVLEERKEAVLWLRLNRAASRNPLSCAMISELAGAMDRANSDSSVKVIVIAAKGEVFCAGHDLKEVSGRSTLAELGQDKRKEQSKEQTISLMLESCSQLMLSLIQSPKPIIACVQGMATAAGCQLVSMCDLAVASEQAGFCTPGVNIGIFCTTPLVGIGRNIARKHAMEMALTGDVYSADDARRFGLINKVVPSGYLVEETDKLAQKIASKSAIGIAGGKQAFYQQLDMPTYEALMYASSCMLKAMLSDECVEGLDAFFNKRSANWGELV